MKNFHTKVYRTTHILCLLIFYFKNRAVYETLWKNIVERGRP